MLKKNKINAFISVIIICLSICFQVNSENNNSSIMTISKKKLDLPLVYVESDDQIFINHDDDFVSMDFPGDGTPENPFRIEDKSIIIDDFSPGIEIYNTTKHFIIQNCFFKFTRIGVRLRYVAANTSLIRNNEFKNNPSTAISIIRTHYSRIENNTGRNNIEGVSASYSNYTSIINNSFIGCYNYERVQNPAGLKLHRSHYASLINNTVNNYEQGIYTRECSGFLVENNTCLYCRADGSIHFYMSSDMLVKRNLIYHNLQRAGIFLTQTHNCRIKYNTIYNSPVVGIALISSDHNKVYQNNFLNNTILLYGEQAYDAGLNNTWYLWDVEEGNYWSDWSGSGPYEIDGNLPDTNYDQYPLSDLYETELEDLYFPNTTNDDNYEENDYTFNNPVIALSITHNLHYADLDFFRINLQKSWKYSFSLDFNYNTIDLDFYLLEEDFYEAEFNVFNGSYSTNNEEWFTFVAPDYGYYYLYVVGDLEHYKEIIPTDYQLTITAIALINTTISQPVGSLFLLNWVAVFINIIVIIYFKKNGRKIRKSSLK